MDFSRIAQAFEMISYVMLAIALAPLFPFLYLVVRSRARESQVRGTGTYGLLLYFATVSGLLLLAGAANLSYGWISTTEIRPFLRRLSLGLFLSGGVFLLLHALLLRRVPARAAVVEARRIFAGFLTTITGMVALAALVLLAVTFFRKVDPKDAAVAAARVDDLKLYGSWTVYYLLTYVACVFVLTGRVRRGTEAQTASG